MEKKDIRRIVAGRRKAVSDEEVKKWSHKIAETVIGLPVFQRAKWLYVYMDYNHEVMTGEIIDAAMKAGKRLAAPKVVSKESMVYYEFTSLDQFEESSMHILEPAGCPEANASGDVLVIMPGVAFDTKLHRVGYGGGYYDRYLSAHPKLDRLAIAFEIQMFDSVPFDTYDILPSMIVTEKEIYCESRQD